MNHRVPNLPNSRRGSSTDVLLISKLDRVDLSRNKIKIVNSIRQNDFIQTSNLILRLILPSHDRRRFTKSTFFPFLKCEHEDEDVAIDARSIKPARESKTWQ